MQTEIELRLLEEDDKNPSGFKIVGQITIEDGCLGVSPWIFKKGGTEKARKKGLNFSLFSNHCPQFDAIELGIKVGDEWWFEGDIIKHFMIDNNKKHIIFYMLEYREGVLWITNRYVPASHTTTAKELGDVYREKGIIVDMYKRIGNIHEGKESWVTLF